MFVSRIRLCRKLSLLFIHRIKWPENEFKSPLTLLWFCLSLDLVLKPLCLFETPAFWILAVLWRVMAKIRHVVMVSVM